MQLSCGLLSLQDFFSHPETKKKWEIRNEYLSGLWGMGGCLELIESQRKKHKANQKTIANITKDYYLIM